jgi:ADP-heptose:LPS heptosyltransferase
MITSIPTTFSPKKILVCQQRQIGDVLLATPCIRLLEERFPDAEIHVLTERKCFPVLENNPRIKRIWTIDKRTGTSGAFSLYYGLRKEQFDLAIDFQQLIRLRLAVLFSGAQFRLTYLPKWYNKFVYNAASPMLKGYAPKAKSGILNILDIKWDMEPPELYISNEEEQWAEDFLQKCGISSSTPFLTIDPTHRRVTRKWPEENYAQLITQLLDASPYLKLFMLYGPGEKEDVIKIKELANNADRCIVSDDMTTIREMCAIQKKAHGHIGNCSSPRHTAVAVGTASIIISGATRPGSWRYPDSSHINLYTDDSNCRWCNKNTCEKGTFECLWAITPEMVLHEAQKLFSI